MSSQNHKTEYKTLVGNKVYQSYLIFSMPEAGITIMQQDGVQNDLVAVKSTEEISKYASGCGELHHDLESIQR